MFESRQFSRVGSQSKQQKPQPLRSPATTHNQTRLIELTQIRRLKADTLIIICCGNSNQEQRLIGARRNSANEKAIPYNGRVPTLGIFRRRSLIRIHSQRKKQKNADSGWEYAKSFTSTRLNYLNESAAAVQRMFFANVLFHPNWPLSVNHGVIMVVG